MKKQDIIRWALTAILVGFMWVDGHTMTSIIVTVLVVANELNTLVLKKIADALAALQAQTGREG